MFTLALIRSQLKLSLSSNSNPSATEATKKSQELSAMAKKSFQGTALKDAKVAMGGQSFQD